MRKILLLGFLAFSSLANAQITEPLRQFLYPQNIIKNPGFEQSKNNWTASGGTFTINTTAANIGSGNAAASWDSNGAAQNFTSTAVAIPAGLYGRNGVAACLFKCASGTCTHTLNAFDGSNILASQTIVSSSTYNRTAVNFIFPSSGNIQLRVLSVASDEPQLFIDGCYVGEADNISQVSQAQFVASAYYPPTGSCSVTRASATLGAFGTAASCPGPTIEATGAGAWTVSTTDVDTPTKLTINNLPPGNYIVTVQTGDINLATSGQNTSWQITDGTTPSVAMTVEMNTTTGISPFLTGYFSYTTSGNRTFEVFGASAANTLTWDNTNTNKNTRWIIYRWPLNSETTYRPDMISGIWSGYHDNNCSWARSSATLGDPTADTTCTFTETTNVNFGSVTSYLSGSDKLPGIVFTPVRTGLYYVCANFQWAGGDPAGTNASLELSDTVPTVLAFQEPNILVASRSNAQTLCGYYNATTLAAKTIRVRTAVASGTITVAATTGAGHSIDWSIGQVTQNIPSPVFVGSVLSNSTGAERIERALIANGGAASISTQSGTWLSSVTRNSAGNVTINITAGMFSATPTCMCTPRDTGLVEADCYTDLTTTPSATVWRIQTAQDAGGAADRNFDFICMGPR
jgi:hypothetical protein